MRTYSSFHEIYKIMKTCFSTWKYRRICSHVESQLQVKLLSPLTAGHVGFTKLGFQHLVLKQAQQLELVCITKENNFAMGKGGLELP